MHALTHTFYQHDSSKNYENTINNLLNAMPYPYMIKSTKLVNYQVAKTAWLNYINALDGDMDNGFSSLNSEDCTDGK